MGTITTTIDLVNSLTMRTVKGETTAAELADAITKYYEGDSTLHILWDLSDADLSRITSADVASLVALTKGFSSRRIGGKTALVFSTNYGFGMGRMYEIQHELSEAPIAHMTFRDKKAALSWLLE